MTGRLLLLSMCLYALANACVSNSQAALPSFHLQSGLIGMSPTICKEEQNCLHVKELQGRNRDHWAGDGIEIKTSCLACK